MSTSIDDPAALVIRERIATQVAEIRRCDLGVRAHDPDAIHDLRVALRRLRTALTTYRAFLDRTVADPIGVELKWLGGMLSAARDAEVQLERLSPLGDEVAAALGQRHRLAHDRAVSALDEERAAGLLTRLSEFGASPPLTAASETPIKEVLPQQVKRAWKRMGPLVDAARSSTVDAVRADLLHDVRKAAKRARYAAEPLVPLGVEVAERTVKGAKQIQTVLGEHQDSATAQVVLEQLRASVLAGISAALLTNALAREAANVADLETEFFKLWGDGAEFTGRSSADAADGIP